MPLTRRLASLALGPLIMLPGIGFAGERPSSTEPTRASCLQIGEATTPHAGACTAVSESAATCTLLVECDENGVCVEFCAGCVDEDGNALPCPPD